MHIQTELADYYQRLRRFGYNDSHSGNISARDGDRFWITPTGAAAEEISANDFLACELEGALHPRASGDANLHQAVYRANPAARAIIHSHGPHSVALTLNGEDFVPLDFEGQLYFPSVPVITVPYETYFADAAGMVAETLAEHRICIVRGHGVYAQAESLNLAYKWTCSLELSARTAYLARTAGAL